MKKYLLWLVVASFTACQTTKIKQRTYKVSNATTEIGSIGQSKSIYVKNDFATHAFPVLDNKIRVDVAVLPFNKKLNKFYVQKEKYNQSQAKIQYTDSVETKPEMVTISVLDIAGYIAEINTEANKPIVTYLKDTKKAKIVTSIATTMSAENMAKIRQADTFYLLNNQDKKYTLVVYKSNKKVETIDLQSGVTIAYELSKCCWGVNKKGNWYLSDIIKECKSCKGNTQSKIDDEKATKNLYKM